VLTSAGSNKINVIKVIRELTGLGLKEAKDLVDSVPSVVLRPASPQEAELAEGLLAEAGASVKVRSSPGSEPYIKTAVNVLLASAGADKIASIKVLRELTSLGLKEAKDLVDSAPCVVFSAASLEEAELVIKRFSEVGALARIQ
jgi:ribosomal protein L7/L12